MADFEPVLSRNWDVADCHTLKVYESRGGYQAARKALTSMDPDKVVQVVKDSELRGRGGAGFPCGMKWSFLPKDRKETFMCINADESEPATFNNRLLMERDPHQLIEGIILGCFATKASTAYLYIRFEYIHAYRILETAIAEAREAGFLGKDILGSGFDLEIYVHRGAGAYICGEETGLIESLEGKRGWPRIKPPFPAIEGAFRKPTVVNNVETLCCVPFIIDRGARLVQVDGDAQELRAEALLHLRARQQAGLRRVAAGRSRPGNSSTSTAGGVWKGRKAKAVVPGGISMGILSGDELDTKLDFEDIRKPGCLGLGTAAVTVMDDQTSMVDYLHNTVSVLRARELRTVHPLPRGVCVDLQDDEADQGRRRPDRRPRHHAPTGQQHGHHARHHDLRPRRRRGLAGQERDGQVPARTGSRTSTHASRGPADRSPPLQEAIFEGKTAEPVVANPAPDRAH